MKNIVLKRRISILIILLILMLSVSSCAGKGDTDLDLTKMSDTLRYSTVVDMNQNPKNYLGKSVLISGTYYKSYFDETQNYYHFVTGLDDTGCCSWGYEFILDESQFSYPAEDAQITLHGTIRSYTELDIVYYYIDVDRME